MNKKYYLGLDIGTNSVGWAVTDEDYKLCRFHNKDMWGIRLFESAKTAEDRRLKRGNRRRLARRNNRITLLQEIFAEEIGKIDSSFFIRLNESRLYLEDKSVQMVHPLFNDNNYTDKDYYKEYPTIFHLRKELILNKDYHDPRLVYLACHHILKNRGHFLINGTLSNAKDIYALIDELFLNIKDTLNYDLSIQSCHKDKFVDILKDKKMTKSTKQKKLISYIEYNTDDKDESKKYKTVVDHVCKLMCGLKGDISKFVDCPDELDIKSFSFSESKYEEEIKDMLEQALPDEAAVIEKIKVIYDWTVLSDILGEEEFLSCAKVNNYNKHNENLKLLHEMIKKYCSRNISQYFFDNKEPEKYENNEEKKFVSKLKGKNYAAYIGSVRSNGKQYDVKRCSEEDFYKSLKDLLESITPNDEDEKILQELKNEIELQSLLPLQRSKDNGVVPKQIHEIELLKILDNASIYLPFLNEKDKDGYTAKDKVISIFNYRIPYYVGPLSDRHKDQGANTWMVRKQEGKIYPWNFKDMVDEEKSNEEFINRMTNKCTYLIGEDVLPKNSILYSQYMILNEINNLKIDGKDISVELKQNIFNDLFMKYKKITGKKLCQYLNEKDPGHNYQKENLSGFDIDFKSHFITYMDFRDRVFGYDFLSNEECLQMVENIIKWITIYGDDKTMLMSVIKNKYPGQFNKEQLKTISKLKYQGWGNFSRKFLTGIDGNDSNGEYWESIISGLWKTNNNLMQLLSGAYTFKNHIDEYNEDRSQIITKIDYENVVEPLATSPANKRAIWQTIQIAEEIKKVMGCEPQKIFVEMARGGDESQKKKRTQSKKQKLIDLYNNCEEDLHTWVESLEKFEERELNSKKLYLYFTQMGRCMYTDEPIELSDLMKKNSKWDIDHIYPQSKIKDNSFDNIVLVKKTENSKKSNELLSSNIIESRKNKWLYLRKNNFISQKKYERLTRTQDFTDDELAGFISRQLVETRQSCRLVAEILKSLYKDSNIIYVKAGLASDFRKKQLNVLKSRLINDYHHAKDAYLNIVVGNVYNTKFTSNPVNWMKKNRKTNYSINRVFDFDVKDRQDHFVWKAPDKDESKKPILLPEGGYTGGTIDFVRKTVKRNNILYTEYTYCAKGQLFDETIAKKDDKPKLMLKKGLDVTKYGGYKSANTSYFAKIEYDGKKGERIRQIVGVPIYVSNLLEHESDALIRYFEDVLGHKNVIVLKDKIKKNSLLIVDGFPLRIRGENEKDMSLKGNQQLLLDFKNYETIRCIEKYLDKNVNYEPNDELDGINHVKLNELYDVLNSKLKTIYKNRPANISSKLDKQREEFINLCALKDKVNVIKEILNSLRCNNNTTSNLKILGEGANVGNIAINKNTLGKKDIQFVNQSVTGLFENYEV